ncbi:MULTISPECIES: hypothetical protein [unclassified Spiroplasma]|uniref:hypothetical protein n=1 Tax=unclassified Spiroplasma TaxID=2637901 RepID=UPI0030D2C0AE
MVSTRDVKPPDSIQQRGELFANNTFNEQQLTQTIDKLKDNQHQIVQGLTKTFVMLENRRKKMTKIFAI